MLLSFRRGLVLSFLLLGLTNGRLLNDPSQLAGQSYDFVVVGAGVGGNVIASRLTENQKVRVLLIEAGGSNEGVEPTIVPFLCTEASPNTPWTWNLTTVPQPAFGNRPVTYPSGQILGGSSSINFMFYTRGSSEDWDRYAKVTGDSGWSWNSIQQYIKKNEKFVPPSDNHNITGEFNPAVHSFTGPLDVSLPGSPTDLDTRIIQTTKELSKFPFNLDMNSGYTLGVGWAQATIANGTHVSSADAYLTPQVMARPNLDLILNSHVTRLIQNGSKNGLPLFRGVEFAESATATRYTVWANQEIILSAGAIHTPQILMLSGIGDKKALGSFGIKSIANLPDVGQNLADHIFLPNQFSVNSNNTLDSISQNATLAQELTEQWTTTKTGRLANTLSNFIGWFRLNKDDPIFRSYPDPAAGPNTAHIEFLFTDGFLSFTDPFPTTGHYMTIVTTISSPASRGTLTLNSSNPFDSPVIDPGYLKSPFDFHALAESVRFARQFLSAPTWKNYVIKPYGIGENLKLDTDEDIDPLIKDSAATGLHTVGTASMSPKGSQHGVVDPDLTVKGVSGIRIVDASILPYVPAAHIQAAVYIVAERAANMIKATQ